MGSRVSARYNAASIEPGRMCVIDLYGMSSPNVLKVVLMLHEVVLQYEFHHVNMMAGDQYTPEFRAINPNSRVPAIVDRDGPRGQPFTVFESGAILMYLAEKTGILWPADMRQRHTVFQWLMFQMGGIGPMSGQYFHFFRAAPAEGNDYSRSRYFTEIRRLYGVLNERLGHARYMAGADYSIADVATWPWARNHEALRLSVDTLPHLARWLAEVGERPAARKMIEAQAEMQVFDGKAFGGATEDQTDRFYGRGKYAAALGR
jgi:GST-like protein